MMNKYQNELMDLSLEDIKRYLLENHWELIDHPNKKISLFSGPKDNEGNELEIVLPKSRDYQDYLVRVKDALRILSMWQNKDIDTVIQEISLTSHDVFKVRILDIGPSGTLPLTVAANDVNALKNLFIYAACAEERSLPFYDKPLSVGTHHAELCEFAHTFQGSFGFTINSPIIDDYCQLAFFGQREGLPFERRVMERIIRSLNLIDLAVMQNNADILVDNFDTGLNARMCEALLEVSQSKTKAVDFDVLWSPKVELSEDIRNRNNWRLERQAYEVLEYAADELKKIEPYSETIIGQIVTLHSTKNPMSDEDFNRQATVKYEYDGKTINVKLELDRRGYGIAYEAHGKGSPIKVTGQLFRKGHTWKMIDIEDISMRLR